MESWHEYLNRFGAGLQGLSATRQGGAAIDTAAAFDEWVDLTDRVHARGGWIYFAGNGGSAAIASHMAIDASKNGELRAMAFNDAAALTAISNDLAFDEVFALPLGRFGRTTDLLITISSSGNSRNIIRAIEVAQTIGMTVVTLSGKEADNRSRAMGDLNFYVPAARYGWVEGAHQIVIHYWFDQYLNRYRQGAC